MRRRGRSLLVLPLGSPRVLRFEGVSKRYRGAYALRDVSFDVPRGKLVALAGPNGSGKTTALRLAATLERPTSGAIEIAGATEGVAMRRHLAWLGEDPGLAADLTLRESLALQASFFGREDDITEAARTFGVGPLLDERAGRLSRGERQRAGLARATLGGELMLLDEPTTALDAAHAATCIDALLALRGARTIVAATHDAELLKRADLVLRLDGGRLA